MFLPQNSSNMQDEENDNEFLPNQSQSYQSIVLEHEQRRSILLAEHSSLPSQGLPSVGNVSRPSNRQESRVSSQQPALISRNDQWGHGKQEDDGENQFMLDQNSLAEQISKALVKEGSRLESNSNSKHFQNHMENDQPSGLWKHSNKSIGLHNQSQNSHDNPFQVRGKKENNEGLGNFSNSQKSQSIQKMASEGDSKMMKDHSSSQEEEYFNIGKKSNAFQSKFEVEEANMNRFDENFDPNQQQSGESDPFRQENESNNNFPGQLHSNVESNPLRSSFNRQSIEKTQNKRKSSEMERPNESSSVNQQDTVSKGEIKIEANSLSQLMMQDRIEQSSNQNHSGRDSLKFRPIDSIEGGSSQAILQSEVNLYIKPITKQFIPKKDFQSIVLRQTLKQGEDYQYYKGNVERKSDSRQKSSSNDPEDDNDLVNQIQMQEYAVKSSNLELRSNKSALMPSGMEPEQIVQSKQSHLEQSQSENRLNNSKSNEQNQLKNNESYLSERSRLPNSSNEQSNNLKNTIQIQKHAKYEDENQQKSNSVPQQSQNNNSYLVEDKTVENMKHKFAQNQSRFDQQDKSRSKYSDQSHFKDENRHQASKISQNNIENLQKSKVDKQNQYNFEFHRNVSSKDDERSQKSNIMNNRSNIFQQQVQQKAQQSGLSKEQHDFRQEPLWKGYSKTSEIHDKIEENGSKSGRNYNIQASELSRIQMNNSQIVDQPRFKQQHKQSLEENSIIPSEKSNHSSVKDSSLKRQTLQQKNNSKVMKNSQPSGQKSSLKGSNSQLSNLKYQSSKVEIENKSKVLSQVNSITKKQSSIKDNHYRKSSKDHKQLLISISNNQQTNSTLFKKKQETKQLIFNTFPEEEPMVTHSQEHNIQMEQVSEKKLVLSPINESKNQLDKREKILSLRTPESKTKKKTQQKEDQIERIRLLKESQKKRLERELEKVKKELEQIQIREKHAERIQKDGEERIPKEDQKLSMHNRHKRQSEAVLKLVKEHRKSRQQEQQQFEDLDRNITNNLMQLSRIRHEAQIKNKEKKRLEIMERMKKNEMRRIQQQKLIKANIQYVQQFRSPEPDREKEKEVIKDKQRDLVRLKGKDRDPIGEKQRNMSRDKERNIDRQRQRERNVITEVKITKLRSVGKRRKDDVYQTRLD